MKERPKNKWYNEVKKDIENMNIINWKKKAGNK